MSAWLGLGEPLGDRHTEGDSGMDQSGSEFLGHGGSARPERIEPGVPSEGETFLDGGERLAVEQVRCMHRVSGAAQIVGEHLHAISQALDVVVQQHVGHASGSFDS
ncbi:hypothetical protein [Nocardioides sp. AE5]|uniref:hypothetical protein n=1 Tax=Nocardioides sp. AE5 TaxID=2962573 RepID=UPI0028811D4B|nr:hypothetical protein [Nocardioides sp. AE5]MDT0203527.1 hypothetical protein [Nocardioides sp. AE5]